MKEKAFIIFGCSMPLIVVKVKVLVKWLIELSEKRKMNDENEKKEQPKNLPRPAAPTTT